MSASDHVPRVTLAALEQELALRIEAIAAAEGCTGKEAAERLLARWRREREVASER
ncbi:MAG TPA: hypothetical protein VM686_33860 [Polyangiaceae bacterium]|nr:hypothetical protein [Polyangiaceae bacterium]